MKTENIKDMIITKLKDKKALDLISIDVSDVTTLTDYFVVCVGSSDRHRKSLADDIIELARELELDVSVPVEGYNKADWILIDCKDVVVNIFEKEARKKYNLERLWADGELEEIREGAKEGEL